MVELEKQEQDCYANATVRQKLNAQTGPRTVLLTDIDNSFYYANDPDAVEASSALKAELDALNIPIIAITGGSNQSVYDRIDAGILPHFDVVAGAVGTEIDVLQQNGAYCTDTDFAEALRKGGFIAGDVLSEANQIIDKLRVDAPELALQLQNPGERNDYKVSLYFTGTPGNSKEMRALFKETFPEFKVSTCTDIHTPTVNDISRFCLDITAANKATPASHVIGKLNIARGLIAVDSGNDESLISETPPNFTAVVVGGHQLELRELVQANLVPYASPNELNWQLLGDGKKVLLETSTQRLGAQSILAALHGGFLQTQGDSL